jgi:hypothetical protein
VRRVVDILAGSTALPNAWVPAGVNTSDDIDAVILNPKIKDIGNRVTRPLRKFRCANGKSSGNEPILTTSASTAEKKLSPRPG